MQDIDSKIEQYMNGIARPEDKWRQEEAIKELKRQKAELERPKKQEMEPNMGTTHDANKQIKTMHSVMEQIVKQTIPEQHPEYEFLVEYKTMADAFLYTYQPDRFNAFLSMNAIYMQFMKLYNSFPVEIKKI